MGFIRTENAPDLGFPTQPTCNEYYVQQNEKHEVAHRREVYSIVSYLLRGLLLLVAIVSMVFGILKVTKGRSGPSLVTIVVAVVLELSILGLMFKVCVRLSTPRSMVGRQIFNCVAWAVMIVVCVLVSPSSYCKVRRSGGVRIYNLNTVPCNLRIPAIVLAGLGLGLELFITLLFLSTSWRMSRTTGEYFRYNYLEAGGIFPNENRDNEPHFYPRSRRNRRDETGGGGTAYGGDSGGCYSGGDGCGGDGGGGGGGGDGGGGGGGE